MGGGEFEPMTLQSIRRAEPFKQFSAWNIFQTKLSKSCKNGSFTTHVLKKLDYKNEYKEVNSII